MANPLAIAAALSRVLTITCPHCGKKKVIDRHAKPAAFRVCPRCHKHLPDPVTTKRKR